MAVPRHREKYEDLQRWRSKLQCSPGAASTSQPPLPAPKKGTFCSSARPCKAPNGHSGGLLDPCLIIKGSNHLPIGEGEVYRRFWRPGVYLMPAFTPPVPTCRKGRLCSLFRLCKAPNCHFGGLVVLAAIVKGSNYLPIGKGGALSALVLAWNRSARPLPPITFCSPFRPCMAPNRHSDGLLDLGLMRKWAKPPPHWQRRRS